MNEEHANKNNENETAAAARNEQHLVGASLFGGGRRWRLKCVAANRQRLCFVQDN